MVLARTDQLHIHFVSNSRSATMMRLAVLLLSILAVNTTTCVEQLKHDCGPWKSTEACETCAESHEADLTPVCKSKQEVVQLCGDNPSPGPTIIPTVTLSNGVKMPLLAQGSGGDNDADAKAGVTLALQNGFTSIDTAHDYNCLSGVGQALTEFGKREQIFLTSKVPGCGVPSQGLEPPCFENTLKVATADLSTLHVDYVDLLLLHFPPIEAGGKSLGCSGDSCAKVQEQWTALEQLYHANKTRAIGMSNYCQDCIECVLKNATVKPMVNQMQYHIGMGADPSGLIDYCHSQNIVLEAYNPLAGKGKTHSIKNHFLFICLMIAFPRPRRPPFYLPNIRTLHVVCMQAGECYRTSAWVTRSL